MPSVQLQTYLQARASGAPVELACEQSGIGRGEAELWEADIASGELKLPRARAHARTREDQPKEESEVARDNEEMTISVNGGPAVPLSTVKEALYIVKGGPTVAADELRLFIERIERLSEERKGIADDISDVYTEAKGQGYDKPTMRRIIRLRGMDAEARQEAAALLETYANALGLQGALPL